jgi:hypothetical protein
MGVFCGGNDEKKYLGTTAKGAHEGKLGCGGRRGEEMWRKEEGGRIKRYSKL